MKNRWISLTLIFALIFAVVGTTIPTQVKAESDVELTVSIWDPVQEPGIFKILERFTEETGIKTQLQVVNWENYWTQLASGASGGQLPDVFWMHSNESQRYMSNDLLLDITDQIEASEIIDLENYPEDISLLYNFNDRQYAVPKDIDTIALWYNKAIFDEAGVEYPTEDWTWEDMVNTAIELTDEDKGIYGVGEGPDNNQAGYYNIIFDYGGYILNEDKTESGWDKPETIEAMTLYFKMIDEAAPSLEVIAENPADVLFTSGKTAMYLAGSWMLASMRDNEYTAENADIQVLPHYEGKRISIYNGLGWAADAKTEHPEEAWKLLEFLGSEEAQVMQADLGVTMSAYEGANDNWVKSYEGFNLQAYIDMMDDMVIRPYSRETLKWETAQNDIMKELWQNNITVEEACMQIAQQMNDFLARENR